ncbi:class I SAM-dependent methyltransferase [Nonlabens xiamenensis]|uniref:class I SAM-dependent methyltransferase n=1 Tax=Nonlabens xiamenensis TaxID=2341043 RepID=UPI000F60E3B2|nr:class I SAM-dependent methyltransferase [Nonlabens xiamenensis]
MQRHPSSFRDPSGYVFMDQGKLYRKILPSYFETYDQLNDQGIYQSLFDKAWLIPHEEISRDDQSIIICPQKIELITYPYEWSFTQYKHAAQLTLRIQSFLLKRNCSLKDASAFNISFYQGKAIHLDTLSIEPYQQDQPWKALLQFNQHFLGPLLLAQRQGSHALKSLLYRIEGVPLKEVKSHLGLLSRFHPVLYPHVHLLAKTEVGTLQQHAQVQDKATLNKDSQLKMLKALDLYIGDMEMKENTEWSQYYDHTNYDEDSFQEKKDLIASWCQELQPKTIMDVGGNDGTFGRQLLNQLEHLVVADIDQPAIDQCYKKSIQTGKVTSLVCDLSQPSPGLGFENQERDALIKRWEEFAPDAVLALALIHHLSLGNNLPFEMTAAFFARFSPYLIIEFPHREDSWVQFLLDSKRDARHLFDGYHVSAFAKAYQQYFKLIKSTPIKGTHRTLFLFQRHEG